MMMTWQASNCRDRGHDVRVRPGVGTFVTYAHGKGKRAPDSDEADTTASKQRWVRGRAA